MRLLWGYIDIFINYSYKNYGKVELKGAFELNMVCLEKYKWRKKTLKAINSIYAF